MAPFPNDSPLLALIFSVKPHIYYAIQGGYTVMWFTTPFITSSSILSLAYIFLMRRGPQVDRVTLPPYPHAAEREDLCVIDGELHKPRTVGPVARPKWLTIPQRGLYTGIGVFGAIGSGKTSCCMYPFAEQILAYRHSDAEQRPGALVLEVKGDFCHKVREILRRYGRESDYVEISLDCEYRYNPLHNDLEAYALAYGIASLLNNLFGKGKEPFWQQAYTNLVKFIVLLHKELYDYVTLFEVYECAINPDLLEKRIEEGRERMKEMRHILLNPQDYVGKQELEGLGFDLDKTLQRSPGKAANISRIEVKLGLNTTDASPGWVGQLLGHNSKLQRLGGPTIAAAGPLRHRQGGDDSDFASQRKAQKKGLGKLRAISGQAPVR